MTHSPRQVSPPAGSQTLFVDAPEHYHVDLDPATLRRALDPDLAPEVLGRLLVQLVEAAGGQAGVMTTRLAEHNQPLTSLYQVDAADAMSLVNMMESLVAGSGTESPANLARVEREARERAAGKPLAIPVRSGGRPVGVFCMWHAAEAHPLLQESPGLVHLNLDQGDVGLQGARLLERLLHERKWLEAVVQHSTDGVVIHDPHGRVMGYNLAMSRMAGWKMGEAVGEPGHEAFPLLLQEHQDHVFDANKANGPATLAVSGTIPNLSATDPVEAKLLARGGGSVEVEITGAPLFDRQGLPLGWVLNVRDITRRKEMDRLHKLFLSGVSHELQTPIAIIRGYAGLLADPDLEVTADSVRKQATVIVEEAQRLEKMVQQMLYATRIQAGGVRLERESFNLGGWLMRLVEKLRPVVQQKGASLLLGKIAKGVQVSADVDKVQQVVTNLVENAVKYAGGRPIRVVLRDADARWARVEVQDNGPGIAQEDRERIFTPFERGGDPLKQRVRGAGLGLYICKAIVEAHGGKIGVESNAKGGATFYFTLPKDR